MFPYTLFFVYLVIKTRAPILVRSWLYNCVFYHLIYMCDQLYISNYMLYIILLHLKVFLSGSIHRSNTIEPAVQPVLNGWTNEPANR